MDLFIVNRFTGDDDTTTLSPSQSILEKLHKKAEEKKKLKAVTEKRKSHDGGQSEGTPGHKTRKKRRKDSDSRTENGKEHSEEVMPPESGGEEEDKIGSHSKKKKKKKHRVVEEERSELNEDIYPEIQENDGAGEETAPREKKRKKKWKSEETNRRLDEDVSEGATESGKVDDVTEKAERKKKKRNKEKRGVSENEAKDEDSPSGEPNERRDEMKEETEKEESDKNLFPVLGNFSHARKEKVTRVLPEWLANPTRISRDVENQSVSFSRVPGLDSRVLSALADMKIKSFFPVQAEVIPLMLESARHGIFVGPAGFNPGDLCVAAPTGSGKTLAFAVPIVQILINRVRQHFRALVVLPTKNLAAQVYKVFLELCQKTPLKVVMIGGQRTMQQEEDLLVKQSNNGEYFCGGDILVATPGRLIDHINHTKGFTLKYLRFLVIDEADSMMVQLSKDWITKVESAVYRDCHIGGSRQPRRSITVESESRMDMPLQKVLFSATLSHNPEHLSHLKLFQPRLVTSTVSHDQNPSNEANFEKDSSTNIDYMTPTSLEEYYMVCSSGEKPLVIVHLLKNLGLTQVLCFTNSVESSHRLFLLLELMGGMKVGEFSSKLSGAQRQTMIKQFKNENIHLLICSDAMTRGMDLSNANYVISYDPPLRLKTYIHRVGRTARAGRKGTAYTVLLKEEVGKFMKMVKRSSSNGIHLAALKDEDLECFTENYQKALKKLPLSLKGEIYQQKNR